MFNRVLCYVAVQQPGYVLGFGVVTGGQCRIMLDLSTITSSLLRRSQAIFSLMEVARSRNRGWSCQRFCA